MLRAETTASFCWSGTAPSNSSPTCGGSRKRSSHRTKRSRACSTHRGQPVRLLGSRTHEAQAGSQEVFDYADPSGPTGHLNRWPAGHDEFRTTLTEFYDTFSQLATDTLGVIRGALGLGDEHSAEELGFLNERTSSAVRLNHYPVGDPVPVEQREGLAELGPTALGYHTDPGVLTLLLQDDTGGLQAESTTHGWIDVPP